MLITSNFFAAMRGFSAAVFWLILPFCVYPILCDSDSGTARQAPFCIDETNTEPHEPGLDKFMPIFQYHNSNPYIGVSPDGKFSPTGLITNFEIHEIKIKDDDSGYSGTIWNWIHISVTSAVPLQGLYVQAISSPWGVPFGEFITNFDCGDCSEKTSTYKEFINIIPCIHRPALAITHPNVFTVGGRKGKRANFTDIHFNFRYTQYPCVDHTYVQFLIIAVRNFYRKATRFETFYSSIFQLYVGVNPIGVYWPFYYGWPTNFVSCHAQPSEDFKLVKPVSPTQKIKYNTMFDQCIVEKAGQGWNTCPPGPVINSAPVKQLLEWERERKRYGEMMGGSKNAQVCEECGTWNWTVGKSEWEPPPKGIIMDPGSLNATDIEEGVDDYNDTCDILLDTKPDSPEAQLCLNEDLCVDVHVSDCDNDFQQLVPPDYGKDGNGNRKETKDDMSFSEQFDNLAWQWGEKYVMGLHGQLLIFAWFLGFNITAFPSRFLKEQTDIEKKSSYHGIGNWLWFHLASSYVTFAAAITGFILVGLQYSSDRKVRQTKIKTGMHDFCNIRNTYVETNLCLDSVGHQYVGGVTLILMFMSYASGWTRPQAPGLRNFSIIYHIGCGYLGKVLGIISLILLGSTISSRTIGYVVLMEVIFILIFGLATMVSFLKDKKLEIAPSRKCCPVPEGVDTLDSSAQSVCLRVLYPVLIVLEAAVYIIMIIDQSVNGT